MILSICSDPKVLEMTKLINIFITIIRIVVPIALIFSLMFKLVGAITKSDEDGLSKVKKIAPYNIIAASLIFLIPNFVNIVVNISFPNKDYTNCLKVVSTDEINILYSKKMDELMSRLRETTEVYDYTNALSYLKNIKNESKRSEYQQELDEIKEQIDLKYAPNDPEIDQSEIVETARQYISKDVERDCSGFVKWTVLRPLNYLQDDISSASGYCDGRSRGSYGMYLKYLEKGNVVWQRDSSARSMSQALESFPGDCVPGDMVFYTYGINDCIKHIVFYVGFEEGAHMIIDSNMYDNIVRYRAIDAVSSNAIPYACARPIKNEE